MAVMGESIINRAGVPPQSTLCFMLEHSPSTLKTLYPLIDKTMQRTREQGGFFCIASTKDPPATIECVTEGVENAVNIPHCDCPVDSGRSILGDFHTHTDNSPFSGPDQLEMSQTKRLKCLGLTGNNGQIFCATRILPLDQAQHLMNLRNFAEIQPIPYLNRYLTERATAWQAVKPCQVRKPRAPVFAGNISATQVPTHIAADKETLVQAKPGFFPAVVGLGIAGLLLLTLDM